MLPNGLDMVRGGEPRGLARLRHQVAYVDLQSWGLADLFRNSAYQEIRQEAGVQRAGSQRDDVRVAQSLDHSRYGLTRAGGEGDLPYARACSGNGGFPVETLSRRRLGNQTHVLQSRRIDAAPDGEDFGGETDGFEKIACDPCQSRQEQVAKTVTLQPARPGESILKQMGHERFIGAKSHETIADVAWRKNPQLIA